MTDKFKCLKLDFLLLKPYFRSMLLVLAVPQIITLFMGSMFDGMSFAATIMAMTTGYTFSIVEKNSLERFYGFLPVKKSALVGGRYLIIFLTGFAALAVSIPFQLLILHFIGNVPSAREVIGTFLLCAGLFCIYAGVQIPGYYRFGSIKGKMFMFIPTVGFLVFYYIMQLLTGGSGIGNGGAAPDIRIFSAAAVVLMAAVTAVSFTVSKRILEKSGY